MLIDAIPHDVPFNITISTYIWSGATINRGDVPDIVIVPYILTTIENGLKILIDFEVGRSYTAGTDSANILWIAIGR